MLSISSPAVDQGKFRQTPFLRLNVTEGHEIVEDLTRASRARTIRFYHPSLAICGLIHSAATDPTAP